MYTFEQLKEDVRKEAEALRVHATKEERERLCLELLDPNHTEKCYYGLMTGECDSDRAVELIGKCAQSFYHIGSKWPFPADRGCITNRWSPIEAYCTLPEAKNANLIAFLRGETETFEL
jgi:hypothetical protein